MGRRLGVALLSAHNHPRLPDATESSFPPADGTRGDGVVRRVGVVRVVRVVRASARRRVVLLLVRTSRARAHPRAHPARAAAPLDGAASRATPRGVRASPSDDGAPVDPPAPKRGNRNRRNRRNRRGSSSSKPGDAGGPSKPRSPPRVRGRGRPRVRRLHHRAFHGYPGRRRRARAQPPRPLHPRASRRLQGHHRRRRSRPLRERRSPSRPRRRPRRILPRRPPRPAALTPPPTVTRPGVSVRPRDGGFRGERPVGGRERAEVVGRAATSSARVAT